MIAATSVTLALTAIGLFAAQAAQPPTRYALVVAHADGTFGPKLQRATVDCQTLMAAPPPATGPSRHPCNIMRGIGKLTARGLPMDQFAGMLSSQSGLTITDKTGLSGNFDWDLTWTPENLRGHAPDKFPAVDPNGPSVFAGLEQQLGLKLIAQN